MTNVYIALVIISMQRAHIEYETSQIIDPHTGKWRNVMCSLPIGCRRYINAA